MGRWHFQVFIETMEDETFLGKKTKTKTTKQTHKRNPNKQLEKPTKNHKKLRYDP